MFTEPNTKPCRRSRSAEGFVVATEGGAQRRGPTPGNRRSICNVELGAVLSSAGMPLLHNIFGGFLTPHESSLGPVRGIARRRVRQSAADASGSLLLGP